MQTSAAVWLSADSFVVVDLQATSDYYRNIYADPDLGPIFKVLLASLQDHSAALTKHCDHASWKTASKPLNPVLCMQGVNMVVLRTHVSYFINQVGDQGQTTPVIADQLLLHAPPQQLPTPSLSAVRLSAARLQPVTCALALKLCNASSRAASHSPLRIACPQLTMFDTAMTHRQLEYLRKTHEPLIVKHNITQRHYDIMLQYLTDAMRSNGAQVCAGMRARLC